MGHFSVRAMYANGKPAKDVGVMIDYGWLGETDEKRTHSDGWVVFHNHGDKLGAIWIHGHNMGNDSLPNGKTYSCQYETNSDNFTFFCFCTERQIL
jgi:hypothetical protein